MMKKSNPEDEVIVKFVDEDFEQLLLISKCKNIDSITEVLNKYQKEEMSYNWDEFLHRLREAHIEFKILRIVKYDF